MTTTTEEFVVARTIQLISDSLHEIDSEYQSRLKHGDIIKYDGKDLIVSITNNNGYILVKEVASDRCYTVLHPVDVAVITSDDEDLKDLYTIWFKASCGHTINVSDLNTKYQQYVVEAQQQLISEIRLT